MLSDIPWHIQWLNISNLDNIHFMNLHLELQLEQNLWTGICSSEAISKCISALVSVPYRRKPGQPKDPKTWEKKMEKLEKEIHFPKSFLFSSSNFWKWENSDNETSKEQEKNKLIISLIQRKDWGENISFQSHFYKQIMLHVAFYNLFQDFLMRKLWKCFK